MSLGSFLILLHVRSGDDSIPFPASVGEQHTQFSQTWLSSVFASRKRFLTVGITYSIIAPLIMIFVITTFSLFYFTYLHNFLYVYEFTTDTGGLSFPKAIYQTMTGIYFAEICLIGLFFITSGARAQGIVMLVVLVLTVLFQIKLASSFDPLITYLPIDVQEELMNEVQQQKLDEGRKPEEDEEFKGQRQGVRGVGDIQSGSGMPSISPEPPQVTKLKFESSQTSKPEVESEGPTQSDDAKAHPATQSDIRWRPSIKSRMRKINDKIYIPGLTKKKQPDMDDDDDPDTDLQRKFAHELTHEELTAIAFQHEALRARPPILWIPNDELGIARDEIHHTQQECGDQISITCEGASMDAKGKIIWEGNPPDYVSIPAI
jgi:calcium permeable stress-gated cation channel